MKKPRSLDDVRSINIKVAEHLCKAIMVLSDCPTPKSDEFRLLARGVWHTLSLLVEEHGIVCTMTEAELSTLKGGAKAKTRKRPG